MDPDPHRLKLQTLLEELLGSTNVYHQPPPSIKMEYPAIVYLRQDEDTIYAGNFPYKSEWRWTVTVIDRNPDSLIPGKVSKLQKSRFSRKFTKDLLHHFAYNLYY